MKTRLPRKHPPAGDRQRDHILFFGLIMAAAASILWLKDMKALAVLPAIGSVFSLLGLMGLMKARAARDRHLKD